MMMSYDVIQCHVMSMRLVPQVSAKLSLSLRMSLLGYSGNFNRLKLEKISKYIMHVQKHENTGTCMYMYMYAHKCMY